jgi:hypothetical protein
MPAAPNKALPYRGEYDFGRPPELASLPLPPRSIPLFQAGRLRKQWRYVAVHSPELQLCAATIAVGPVRQCFWAIWDRERGGLYEAMHKSAKAVQTREGRLIVKDGEVEIDLELDEVAGVETVTGYGRGWAWTRKQGGIKARGTVKIGGREIELAAPAIIDDSAGFPPRHVDWKWSAGVGTAADGRAVAWNFVDGIHDFLTASERTVWIDGVPIEVGPCQFAEDLSSIRFAEGGTLSFNEEATRSHRENLLIVRSAYEQPFGSFSGELPHVGALREGLGVMERHSVAW